MRSRVRVERGESGRRYAVSREYDASPAAAWRLLANTEHWPTWGPSVSAVRPPAAAVSTGLTGEVQVLGGPWVPFEIADVTVDDARAVVRRLDDTTVDLIDISGGTYFPGAAAASHGTSGRPYFLDFAARARAVTAIPLMTTGGFRTRAQAGDAVASSATDLVGLARAVVLDPELPATWLTAAGGDPAFPRFERAPPGGITAWYTLRLTALGEDREAGFDLDPPAAIRAYERRDEQRCARWNARFRDAVSAT